MSLRRPLSITWNTFFCIGPDTILTPPTNILEELLERSTFFHLRARNTAVFRISEPEVTVQTFLCLLLALKWHVELHTRLISILVSNRMYVPREAYRAVEAIPVGLWVSGFLPPPVRHNTPRSLHDSLEDQILMYGPFCAKEVVSLVESFVDVAAEVLWCLAIFLSGVVF